MEEQFDLLSTVEYGGCSAKLSPKELTELLKAIPIIQDSNIMVDVSTHDDAGVYRLNDTTALIVTTDFFPPVCSGAGDFGEIAAANSLSDIYAMGGTPLLALNLNMFPSKNIPLTVLRDILLGGARKVQEAGAFTMGGHTIDDATPKYGLAVVGTVSPDKLITNSGLREGDVMILTKPLGVGVIITAQRMGIADSKAYNEAIKQMKLLNKHGAEMMQKYGVKGATDITGFGLAGHSQKMASASGVTIEIDSQKLPSLPQVIELLEEGCIPGAAFRNLDYIENKVLFLDSCTTSYKMLCCDAQTSGGLLMGVSPEQANLLMKNPLCQDFHIIGRVVSKGKFNCVIK
ncbi:MAG: selenide, water dikinase SelD [Rikenellaceae bacterium]